VKIRHWRFPDLWTFTFREQPLVLGTSDPYQAAGNYVVFRRCFEHYDAITEITGARIAVKLLATPSISSLPVVAWSFT